MVLDSGSTPGSHRENQPKIGQIGGINLLLIPARMLVQAWRAAQGRKKDVSFLVRKFSKAPGAWRVDLVHAGIPKYDHQGVREGWVKYYWKPFEELSSRKSVGTVRYC